MDSATPDQPTDLAAMSVDLPSVEVGKCLSTSLGLWLRPASAVSGVSRIRSCKCLHILFCVLVFTVPPDQPTDLAAMSRDAPFSRGANVCMSESWRTPCLPDNASSIRLAISTRSLGVKSLRMLFSA